MKKTCKKCGEEFRVLDAKPDAEFCSGCIEILVQEQKVRQAAAEELRRDSLTASVRKNVNHRKKERQHEIKLEQMGFKVVRRLKTRPVAE
jgi:hypothetical protein